VAKVLLARNQSISVNGRVLLGTRDFDIDVDSDAVDVTPWDSGFRGEMPLTEMTTITLQVYHLDEVALFMAAWNQFPPQPLLRSAAPRPSSAPSTRPRTAAPAAPRRTRRRCTAASR
jgi:hypothetical protein